ncbi:MAG: hypothetical protein ACXVEF_12405 [Polyangiales bacterium]
MQAAAQQTFQYGFLTLTCTASIADGIIEVKQGIRTWRVPIVSLRHLYLRRHGGGQYDELLLGTEPAPNKKKVFRFSANAGQPQFRALADTIAAYRPDIDRRAMPEKEAMAMMGAKNVEMMVLVGVLGIIPLILAIALLPMLIHGLDSGKERVKLSQLVKGKSLESHNLVISGGRVLTEKSLSVTTVNKRNGIETSRSTSYYVPLVPKDWDEGDPIKVVIKTKQLSNSEIAELEESDVIPGVARDVLWEGLDSKQADWFKEKGHLELSKDVILLEYKADSANDLLTYCIALGATTVTLFLIGVFVAIKQRKTG